MNITLSADEELVKKAREYAARHETSLNGMIRAFMRRITGSRDVERDADEFAQLALRNAGASDEGFVFNRDEAHQRQV